MNTGSRNNRHSRAESSARRFGIMAPLRPVRVGDEYFSGGSPAHVTLLGNFEIALGSDEILSLIDGAHPESALRIEAGSRALFGPNADVAVTVLAEAPELRELHAVLLDILVGAGAVLDDPEHAADGYRPHVTDTADGAIPIGDVVTLESMALFELEPGGLAGRRRFVGVRSFAPRSRRS